MNEKLKKHFIDHKELYIGIGIGVCVAGFTCYITRETSVLRGGADITLRGGDGGVNQITHSLNLFSKHSGNAVATIKKEGRGPTGYVTRCIETGIAYATQGDAARAHGVTDSLMSGHLNEKIPDIDGLHFERYKFPEAA